MKVIKPVEAPLNQPILTRASTGTYINASGSFAEAAVNEARFTYGIGEDGRYHYEGLMVEGARTNYFLNTWTGSFASLPSLANQTVAVGSTIKAVTISFYGTGKIIVRGVTAITGGSVVYSKTIEGSLNPLVRTHYTLRHNVSATHYTVEVTGQVYAAQFEVIDLGITDGDPTDVDYFHNRCSPTSWIPTMGSVGVRQSDIISGDGIVTNQFVETNPDWNSATVYNKLDRVVYNDEVYESVIDFNSSNLPDITHIDETKWLFVQVRNQYALFDLTKGAKSTAEGESFISLVIASSATINALSAIELLSGNTDITISASNNLGRSVHTKYSSYFNSNLIYDQSKYTRNITITDANLPTIVTGSYTYYVISLRIRGALTNDGYLIDPTESLHIGELVIGETFNIGNTQYGLQAGITDYSVKETDAWGNINLVVRNFSKKLSGNVYVPKANCNDAVRTLYNLRASPTVWIATDDEELSEMSTVFGYMKDFTPLINYPTYVMFSLEIEGLTI